MMNPNKHYLESHFEDSNFVHIDLLFLVGLTSNTLRAFAYDHIHVVFLMGLTSNTFRASVVFANIPSQISS